MHNPIKILVSSTLHAEMVEHLAGYVNIASNTVQNIRQVITGAGRSILLLPDQCNKASFARLDAVL